MIVTLHRGNGPSKPRKSIDTGPAHQRCANAAVLTNPSVSDIALTFWSRAPYWNEVQLASELKRSRGQAQDAVEDIMAALADFNPATSDNTRQAFVGRVEAAWTDGGLTRETLRRESF